MNACSIDETSGESAINGGYYTSSLIDSANEWARIKLSSINSIENYSILSTQDCHLVASAQVKKLSGERQNSDFESSRMDKKYPFAVVA